MKYYLNALKNYANFTGRARRSEYWYFVLFNFLFVCIAAVLDNLMGTTFSINTVYGPVATPYGYVYLIYCLAVFLPGLAVSVRRLHDTGKTGWYLFVSLIPIAGAIWLLVLLITDSTFGSNKYGPNPKGIGNYDEIEEIGNDLSKQSIRV